MLLPVALAVLVAAVVGTDGDVARLARVGRVARANAVDAHSVTRAVDVGVATWTRVQPASIGNTL